MEDGTPLPQLATLEVAEDAHLQLLNEVQAFSSKLEQSDYISASPADDPSRALGPFEGRRGVCEALHELQDLLQKDPSIKKESFAASDNSGPIGS